MRLTIGILFCVLLTATGARAADCTLNQADSIDLSVVGNELKLPITIGGVPKTVRLELESPNNGLDQAVVDELQIPTRMVRANLHVKFGSEEIRRLAYPPLLHIGQIDLKSPEFLVLPADMTERDETAGFFGLQQFANVDFEIDLAHGKFNLFLADHCPGQVVYWTQSPAAQIPFTRDPVGFINLTLSLDGTPLRARLTSGGNAYIGMNAMRHYFGIDERNPGMTLLSDSDAAAIQGPQAKRKLYRYNFKTLGASGLNITNPNIYVYGEDPRPDCQEPAQDKAFQRGVFDASNHSLQDVCYGAYDLALSIPLLKQLRLFLSNKDHLVYATAAAAH